MDETAIVTINGGNLDHLHHQHQHQHQHQRRPTKTRTSPFNIIRAALFMLRRPSSAAKSPARISSKPFWKSLVVAVRPLHHQQPHHSPINRPPHPLLPNADSFKEAQSPVALILSEPSSARSLDRDQDSVYASAQNLQELDKSSSEQDIDDDDDYGQDNINGDEMIDSKAEDFIAHFYAQMRLQRLESMERYNAKNSIKIN